MALCTKMFLFLLPFLLCHSMARADTCSDCFTQSRAAYYPNSDQQGTESGACEYGAFGATLNGGDVSAASNLYKNGVGCGACYQVRCTNAKYCSNNGVTIVITDSGASDNTDFILSQHAFSKMGLNADAGASLLSLGVVGIEYRRVSCSYPSKNITFKIDQSSNNPYYFAFQIWYQQGNNDIAAVQLCETENLTCKLLERSHGAVWAVASPPRGALSLRMMLSGGDDGDETWLVPPNDIPQNWTAGALYDSGIQVQ
ncbi:expansin-like B1 isoform X1 [Canna indica]|uniref:Expansin-like B1 isoform X1 n=1 Tax=Canna indica TaxID=4628 RepID=A0AAQ3KEK3_9LILI|nr:expansin-like B1 isoform X1 [Canna indica]